MQGFAARVANIAISSSPVALLFGADPEFQYFREPASAQGQAGFGVQAEVFVNYAITPNIDVGAGARYWQLVTQHGQTTFTGLGSSYPIDRFEQVRYGVLLQAKGKF